MSDREAAIREDVERLAAEFHAIYQAEAKRQGDVRHHDDYDALPENVKEFDRVLARHVLDELAAARDYVARAAVGNIDRARVPLTQREWLERFERSEEREAKLRKALLGMVEEVETLERHGRLRGYEHLLGVTAKARKLL